MPSMKRPAAAALTTSKAMKKEIQPAAKPTKAMKKATHEEGTGALNEQMQSWSQGVGTSPSDVRDKGKGEKFSKMAQHNQIPDFVMDLYNHPPPGESKRSFRTQLINKLFVRRPSGTLDLSTQDALFVQAKAAYEHRYHKAEVLGYTRLMFCGQFFANNEQKMQQAIDEGEVSVEQGQCGTTFYNFKKQIKGMARGSKNEHKIESKKKLDKSEYEELSDIMEELKWHYKLTKKDGEALDKGKLPPAAAKVIEEAIAAQEKLSKQALQLATKSSMDVPEEKLKELKQGHMTAKKHLSTLQHILSFKEFENHDPVSQHGLDKLLLEIASDTAKLNRDVEMAKGSVRSKKN